MADFLWGVAQVLGSLAFLVVFCGLLGWGVIKIFKPERFR